MDISIHTGETTFHCSLCSNAFSKLAQLTKHKQPHSGEKSFQCSYCEKTFYRSCTLNKHKQSHIGEKPFQCSICQKSSTQPSHLTMHTQEVIVESIHNNATSVRSRIKIIDWQLIDTIRTMHNWLIIDWTEQIYGKLIYPWKALDNSLITDWFRLKQNYWLLIDWISSNR